MQIAHATDKENIWMVHSGSGPFAHNKLRHSECKFACAEGYTSKQYTETVFLAIMTILLQCFRGIGGGVLVEFCFVLFLF